MDRFVSIAPLFSGAPRAAANHLLRITMYPPRYLCRPDMGMYPALVPEMRYDGLDVAEGTQAGLVWGRFVDVMTPAEEKSRLKRGLLEYCGQDTLALARIVEVLLKKARTPIGLLAP
jgi:hypothetical protein